MEYLLINISASVLEKMLIQINITQLKSALIIAFITN